MSLKQYYVYCMIAFWNKDLIFLFGIKISLTSTEVKIIWENLMKKQYLLYLSVNTSSCGNTIAISPLL